MIRRDFLKNLGGTLLACEVFEKQASFHKLLASTDSSKDLNHFLLIFDIPGGLDPLYGFDSRDDRFDWDYYAPFVPREGIENYVMKDGSSLWMAPSVKSFKRHLGDFSVVNGLHMLESFPGHPQNINYMFTGNVGGGSSFVPEINQGIGAKPLDFIRLGQGVIEAQFNNMGDGVLASTQSLENLKNSVQGLPDNLWSLGWHQEIQMAFKDYFKNDASIWNNTIKRFNRSIQYLDAVHSSVSSNVEGTSSSMANDLNSLSFAFSLVRNHLVKSILYVFDSNAGLDGFLDCHFEKHHVNLHRDITKIFQRVSSMIDWMKSNEFDSGRSFFDVCTVVICSEFGRTFVNRKAPYPQLGTDHNPFNNSILIGGRGIHSGQVIGSSDFRVSEKSEEFSKAHLEKDPQRIASFGHVFDFETGISRKDILPEAYQSQHYLTGNSILNTILEIYGVPKSQYRGLNNTSELAPVVKNLLA